MRYAPIMFLALLASCGADGPPIAPGASAPDVNLSVSGDARFGVTTK